MANWAINRKAGSVNLIDWNIKNRESLMPALDYLVLLWIVAISRWVYRSHSLYHMDSIDYALGMEYFSPTVHQPHPPGSYLYVKLAQLVHNVLPNSNDTLVAISIVASCAAAALTYRFAHVWFGRAAARWSGILFVLSTVLVSWHGGDDLYCGGRGVSVVCLPMLAHLVWPTCHAYTRRYRTWADCWYSPVRSIVPGALAAACIVEGRLASSSGCHSRWYAHGGGMVHTYAYRKRGLCCLLHRT